MRAFLFVFHTADAQYDREGFCFVLLVFILFLTLFCYVSSLKPFAVINDGLGLKHFRSVKSRLSLRWILRWWKRKRERRGVGVNETNCFLSEQRRERQSPPPTPFLISRQVGGRGG